MDGAEGARPQAVQDCVLNRSPPSGVWGHTQELVFVGDKVPINLLSGLSQDVKKIISWSAPDTARDIKNTKDIKDEKW